MHARLTKSVVTIAALAGCLALSTRGAEEKTTADLSGPDSSGKPLRVFFLSGQSNMVGSGQNAYLHKERPELLKPRKDAWGIKWGHASGPLGPGYGFRETSYGPELMLGHILGNALEEEVVLIKAAWGGKTLVKDFRPPSAVKNRGGKVGIYYTLMMKRFAQALQQLDTHVPAVAERGYELSGFVWLQGENDCCVRDPAVWQEYELNLKDLISDVRATFGVPDMPMTIIQINKSMWGNDEPDPKTGEFTKGGHLVRKAQQAVAEADPRARWVLTQDLAQGYHYDSHSHLVIGQRAGRKTLELLGGEVRNDKGSPAVKRLIERSVLAERSGPVAADLDSLGRGLFAYFPFDEGAGDEVSGAPLQPVKGVWVGKRAANPKRKIEAQNVWHKGLFGSALRFTGETFLEFPDFREPTDEQGRIADLTVSFWMQTNSKQAFKRIGRGAGRRMERTARNWFYSHEANYAGWDISHTDVDGPAAFTMTFNDAGPWGVIGENTAKDGVEWCHVVAIWNGKARETTLYVDGKRYPQGVDRKSGVSRASVPVPEQAAAGGTGIVPALVPLFVGGKFSSSYAFCGYDELCFWDRPLSAAEVKALYNNGHGVDFPNDLGKE